MKNVRIIIALCSIIIISIIVIQVVWLTKLFTLEEKEFNFKAVKALTAVEREFNLIRENVDNSISGYLERPDESTYLLRANRFPAEDTLKQVFTKRLEDVELFIDCRVAVYDHYIRDYQYQFYVKGPASVVLKKNLSSTDIYSRNYNYVFINFPNRSKYILGRLDQWIISTGILIATLTGLLILMIYFLRQRHLLHFQKDFVNNLVHEFKTPLSVMKISGEVLTRENISKQPEKLKQYAGIIASQTEHLHAQVEELLKVTTYGKKRLEFKLEPVLVSNLLNGAVEKVQPLIEQRGAEVEISPVEEDLELLLDRSHFELAIINLIENALKYSNQPRVILSAVRNKKICTISVKDNGIGIRKEHLKNLFLKFYRVPSGDVHNAKGFGLGLNFVKKVVNGHKGKIVVTSVPEIGSEFKIILPVK